MKLFISHASEDKMDFVRPLAEALREDFDVWYDEYQLTLGDSLSRQINRGLAACDYGVVVLSHAFFSKEWPQKELDGLEALETTSRKVILPIWKDIDKERVAAYSPILAGRLAVASNKGVSEVVAEIRRAIDVGERSRKLTALEGLASKFQSLDNTLKARKAAEQLRHCEEGATLVRNSFNALCRELQEKLLSVSAGVEELKFSFEGPNNNIFEIKAPFRIRINLRLADLALNGASNARLNLTVYHLGKLQKFGERGEPDIREEIKLFPDFVSDRSVIWKEEQFSADGFTLDQFGNWLLEKLYKELNEPRR